VAQGRVQCCGAENTVINLRVLLKKGGNIFNQVSDCQFLKKDLGIIT
jgi:hypothetical protein